MTLFRFFYGNTLTDNFFFGHTITNTNCKTYECEDSWGGNSLGSDEIRKKILVMDDEDMVGDIACQMLDYLGFDTVHVLDGQAAILEFQTQKDNGKPFDAVIMDLTIPGGMGGKEAVTAILAIDAAAKVFVSSGYSTDPAMVRFEEYGFAGAIVKPFDLAAIQEILARLV